MERNGLLRRDLQPDPCRAHHGSLAFVDVVGPINVAAMVLPLPLPAVGPRCPLENLFASAGKRSKERAHHDAMRRFLTPFGYGDSPNITGNQ